MQNSTFGKNNFDRLEAALVMGAPLPNADQVKQKLEIRIANLTDVHAKVHALRLDLNKLHVATKNRQMKMLVAAVESTTSLYNKKLPVGTKQPLKRCLNELTSLHEGVFTGAATDKKQLSLFACKKAEMEIAALIDTAKSRLNLIEADTFDMQKLYDEAHDVITKNADEVNKLKSIKDKPFVIARVPVVPLAEGLSIEKLKRAGFSVDNLAGYPSIDKQIVLGINPKQFASNPGLIKQDKMKGMIDVEAKRIIKEFEKQLKTKLYFVSGTPFTKLSGTWFWLMTENDMNRFHKAFPASKKTVPQWGFAFN